MTDPKKVAQIANEAYPAWVNAFAREFPRAKLSEAQMRREAFTAGVRAALAATAPTQQ